MPSLDQFKEKKKTIKGKKINSSFIPKRYAPYLLQEEIINNTLGQSSQNLNTVNLCTDANINDLIVSLHGIKKKLLFYFIELCNSNGGLTTGPITAKTLVNITDSTHKSIKKIIQDMLKENLIKRIKGKPGKGGFSIFLVTNDIKQAITEYNGKINVKSIEETGAINNNDIIEFVGELPKEWKEINYNLLESIGFSESQLRQLYNKKLNMPQIIQASIDHFSFGLIYNKDKFNKYTDPLNVLMGVLRNGGRWIEKNYETSQDQALKSLLEEQKQREENREKLIAEITELEFPEWEKQLKEEQKKAIVPENIFNSQVKKGITATLRVYFKEKILLPRLKEQGAL